MSNNFKAFKPKALSSIIKVKDDTSDFAPATYWCNIIIGHRVDENTFGSIRLHSFALDNIGEKKCVMGTKLDRILTQKYWSRLLDAASKLEPGESRIIGSKDGEIKEGIQVIVTRASDTASSSSQAVKSKRNLSLKVGS